MPKFKFTRDYDHRVRSGCVIAYKAGQTVLIPLAHARAAKKAGVGAVIKESCGESRKPKTSDPV